MVLRIAFVVNADCSYNHNLVAAADTMECLFNIYCDYVKKNMLWNIVYSIAAAKDFI